MYKDINIVRKTAIELINRLGRYFTKSKRNNFFETLNCC